MIAWLAWLRDVAGVETSALVSILASEGSAPRGAGTRMLVTATAQYGTIGGGQLEFRAVEQARAILAQPPGSWRVQDYPLGPLLGQCCGGRVRLLIEHVDPTGLEWIIDAAEERVLVSTFMTDRIERHLNDHAVPTMPPARGDRLREGASVAEVIGQRRMPVYLFGAGHVGQAIAHHAANLPFRLAWFDTRPVFEAIEGVVVVPEAAIEQCVEEAPDDAAILILTHDHALDYRVTKAALNRSPVAFIGLIGSATKRARFLSRLEGEGLCAQARARLTSPIGVAGITGKEPDVIAIATLAQLLQMRAA
ncbi:MAG: xanthine dehydrogenase accessory protein XdhC [Sphingobium sp.]|nr:xanthine dehydrogenase accessory protein XdhC [Sphingobium sp.]